MSHKINHYLPLHITGDGRGIGQAFTDQETAQEQPQQPPGHPGVQGQLGLRLERRRPRGGEEKQL